MAQADDLNNTSSLWWSLAQTLVWIILRIKMLPRDAEQIANSPEMKLKIEGALNELKRAFRKAVLGVTEGMPIDKFRIPCGRHYEDLLTLIPLPLPAEPSALSATVHELQETVRWQEVECNSDWLKRAFPASASVAGASVPVVSGRPVWDWPDLIKHLKERKLAFFTKQDALEYYQNHVQRIDRTKAGDGPDVKSVRSACKRYDLHQYVTISRPSA